MAAMSYSLLKLAKYQSVFKIFSTLSTHLVRAGYLTLSPSTQRLFGATAKRHAIFKRFIKLGAFHNRLRT